MNKLKLWMLSLLLVSMPAYAVDQTIADLDPRGTLAATDLLECEATGTPGSYKCTLSEVVTFAEGTADSFTLEVDFPADLKTDVISESTADTGVTIDGVLLKNGAITVGGSGNGITGNGSAILKVDGNAQVVELGDPATDPVTVTDAGQLHVSDERVTGTYFVSANIVPGDTASVLLFRAPFAITLKRLDCVGLGGTSVNIEVEECDANGANCVDSDAAPISCTTTNANDASITDSTIDAGDYINLTADTEVGTFTEVSVTLQYTVTQ